jgi:hypothetical protein
MNRRSHRRLLAIDLSGRGFAFAVFDGSKKLADWGTRVRDASTDLVTKAKRLINSYKPHTLAVLDPRAPQSRRPERTIEVSDTLMRLAQAEGLETMLIPWTAVQRVCTGSSSAEKQVVAAKVAERFPELTSLVPPKRKPWESEYERMNVLDAVALGHTAYIIDGQFHEA